MTPKKLAYVDRKRCVSCGTCVQRCPRAAITVWRGCYAVVDCTRCVGCGNCARECPANCIVLRPREGAS